MVSDTGTDATIKRLGASQVSYRVEPAINFNYNFNLTFLNSKFIENINLDNLNITSQDTNPRLFHTDVHNVKHYYIIYTIMAVNMIVLMVGIAVFCVKQAYSHQIYISPNAIKPPTNVELVDQNIQNESSSNNEINDVPVNEISIIN